MSNRITRGAAAVMAAIILCILSSCAAPLIDTPAMRANAAQGVAMLRDQYGTPQTVGGFKSAQLDNYTSILILKTAAYTGAESFWHRAFGGLRADLPAKEGQSDWDAYGTYGDGRLSPTQGLSYTRYWHGYTLPLRLLLCVLNAANIQMLLYFVQTALMAYVLMLMLRRGLGAALPGFFAAYFVMMPFVMGICLQYMTVSLPMLLACIAVVRWDERIDSAIGMPAFFAVVGVVINYLDLLTFPLASLGFPLVLLLLVRLKREDSFTRLLGLAVACCAAWGLGYGGMWALKWVITGACFGWDRLYAIFAQIFLRVSAEANGASFSRLHALRLNLDVILSKSAYLLILGLTGLASLLPGAKRLIRGGKLRVDARALVLLVPLALAPAWYIVMANHSVDHTYYTYRSLAASVFALFALIACLFAPGEKSA